MKLAQVAAFLDNANALSRAKSIQRSPFKHSRFGNIGSSLAVFPFPRKMRYAFFFVRCLFEEANLFSLRGCRLYVAN